MREHGGVQIPQQWFIAALRMGMPSGAPLSLEKILPLGQVERGIGNFGKDLRQDLEGRRVRRWVWLRFFRLDGGHGLVGPGQLLVQPPDGWTAGALCHVQATALPFEMKLDAVGRHPAPPGPAPGSPALVRSILFVPRWFRFYQRRSCDGRDAQAAGDAERRQEADGRVRQRADPLGGVHRGAADGR